VHLYARRVASVAGLAALTLAVLAAAAPARAQSASTATAPGGTASLPADSGLWARSNLFDGIGGARTVLGQYGISLGLTETSEVLGNVTGGVHQGADYDGLTELSLGLDTQHAFGWKGGTFNVSLLQIHGRNLDSDNLEALQGPSGISADRATRLWELWYQQALPGGRIDVKLGQQSIDQEFMVSATSALFMNTAMGWPALPAADLYAGGPTYPLSSLGIRLRARPTDALTVLAGVFDDNPPGGAFDADSQLRGAERTGTLFNLDTGALFIAELQFATNLSSSGNGQSGGTQSGLPGTYKLGFWYDTGAFPDQRFDTQGVSLASPASNGVPAMHHGNASVYGLADQMLWRPDPQGARAVSGFLRAMGAPGARNLLVFSADAGLTMTAPLPGRDNDSAGIGIGFARISGAASALDRDMAAFGGMPYPVRGAETFIEATYVFQAAPWWTLQPDVQYIFMPGGGIPNPEAPGKRIGNETILGLRTAVTF